MRFRVFLIIALLTICTLCAAGVAGYDMGSVLKGILSVESGGNPYSINDNATRRSYKFSSKSEAVKMANYLLSLDHNIDMGQYQINSIQLRRGWKVDDLFESSFSRSAAETVFTEWVNLAKKLYGETTLAWQRAIGAYNSGGAGLRNGNPTYTSKVMFAMGLKEAPLDRGDASMAPADSRAALSTLRAADDDEDDAVTDEADLDLSSGRKRDPASDQVLVGVYVLALFLILACFGGLGLKAIGVIISMSIGFGKRLSKMQRGK